MLKTMFCATKKIVLLIQKICTVYQNFFFTPCQKILNFAHFIMFWNTFLCFGTLSHVLQYFLMFWHTFSCFGTLPHVLAHFLIFWHTFSYFGTLSYLLMYFHTFWHTFLSTLELFLLFLKFGCILAQVLAHIWHFHPTLHTLLQHSKHICTKWPTFAPH